MRILRSNISTSPLLVGGVGVCSGLGSLLRGEQPSYSASPPTPPLGAWCLLPDVVAFLQTVPSLWMLPRAHRLFGCKKGQEARCIITFQRYTRTTYLLRGHSCQLFLSWINELKRKAASRSLNGCCWTKRRFYEYTYPSCEPNPNPNPNPKWEQVLYGERA